MKNCRSDQVFNPVSGRCVLRTGKIGQAIIKEDKKTLLKEKRQTKEQIKGDSKTKKFRPVTITFDIIVFEMNKEDTEEKPVDETLPKINRWVDDNLDKIVATIAEPYIKNNTLKLKQVNTLEAGGLGKGGPMLRSRNRKKEQGIYNIFKGFTKPDYDLIYGISFYAELREDWAPKLWQSPEILKTVYNDELHKNKRNEYKILENGEQGISYVLNSLEIEYDKYDAKRNRLPTKRKKKIHLGKK